MLYFIYLFIFSLRDLDWINYLDRNLFDEKLGKYASNLIYSFIKYFKELFYVVVIEKIVLLQLLQLIKK